MLWQWYNPVKIVFGNGSLNNISSYIGDKRKVLLVTGRKFLKESGLLEKIYRLLGDVELLHYDRITPEPDWRIAQELVDFVREHRPDCIVAVGGGSVLDVSKLAASLSANEGNVRDLIGIKEPFNKKGTFIIAVPTTSGSGSEVTPYCVIIDKEKFKKAPVTSVYNYPDIAICDPEVTFNTPFEISRNAGVDALSHCLEAFLSRKSSSITREFSIKGMYFIFRYLKNAIEDDPLARRYVMLASLYGGLAISNAGAGLIHQLGHALTVLRGYSHGYTMGIYMIPVLEYYGDKISGLIREIENELGIKNFIGFLNRFLTDIGIPDLCSISLSDKEIEKSVNFVASRKSILEVLPVSFSKEGLANFIKEYCA